MKEMIDERPQDCRVVDCPNMMIREDGVVMCMLMENGAEIDDLAGWSFKSELLERCEEMRLLLEEGIDGA